MTDSDTMDYIAHEIDSIYLRTLGRHAQRADLKFQSDLLRQGNLHISEMEAMLQDSDEYKEKSDLAVAARKKPMATRHGFSIYLDPHDFGVSRNIFLTRDWSPQQTKIMKSLFKSVNSFVDIGAHIGFYSLLCASVSPTARITSFEPVPGLFSLLKKNIFLNKPANITPVQKAVLDRNETSTLYLSDESNTGDNRPFDDDLSGLGGRRDPVRVDCVRLDDYLRDAPDMIKMDIQGGEMLALEGMQRILESPRLALVSEFWPRAITATGRSPMEMLRMLAKHGLEIYEISKSTGRLEDKEPEQILADNLDEHPDTQTDLVCVKNMELDTRD